MRMVFTQHVTHGTRRFLEFCAGVKPQLGHGINNAALHRLETVTDVRQRTVHDHVHGVVQVRVFSKLVQGKTLCAILCHFTH